MNPTMKVEGKNIGLDHPTYFIADIAANHDGDLGRAKELIHLAAEAGADAVKFAKYLPAINQSEESIQQVKEVIQTMHQLIAKDKVERV